MSDQGDFLIFPIEDINEPHNPTVSSTPSSSGFEDRRAPIRSADPDDVDDDSVIAHQPRDMSTHGFQGLAHDSNDVVLALHFNDRGDRLVSGSADHRIRVMKLVGEDEWNLVDVWRGHDGEVLDVRRSPFASSSMWLTSHSIGQMERLCCGSCTWEHW